MSENYFYPNTPIMLEIPDPHYRQMFQHLPCPLILLLPDLTIAAATDEYLSATNTVREKITLKSYFDVFITNGQRNDIMRQSFQTVKDSGQDHTISLIQFDITDREGKRVKKFWTIKNTVVRGEDNQLLYIIQHLTDRTGEVVESENPFEEKALFRSLIENSSEGISLADSDANVFYRSPAVAKMMGNLPRENALSRVHPDELEEMKSKAKEVVARPGEVIPFRARFRNEWGAYIWLEGTFTNLLHVKEVKAVVTNFRDVTERVEAENKLLQGEQQFFNTLNNMLEGIQILDYEWRYHFVNEALLRNTRSTREELLGHTLMEKYPGIENTNLFTALNRVMKTRVTERMETEFTFPDGVTGYYQLSIEPVPEGIFVLSIDISEKRGEEQKRMQSEENLKAIFDNATEGFILTDKEGLVKAFNNKVKDSLLVNISDEIKQCSSIYDLTEEERKPFLKEIFKKVLTGSVIQYDRQYRRKDEKNVCVNFTYNPVWKDGVIQGVCITGRDITDRKRAEEALRKSYAEKQAMADRMSVILNTLPANIALVDKSGSIIEVNDAWRSFTADGFKGKDYTVGKNYISVSKKSEGEGKEDKVNMASGLEAVLEEELDEFVYEYSSDESPVEKWYRMVATPLQEEEYAGAVIMHMDISEIRRLEAERMRNKIDEQKKITQAIWQGAEKERNHIGRELHDNINQILAGTRMYLAIAANKNPVIKENIQYPMELLDKSMEEIRLLCSEMVTPLQDIKLEDMIKDMLLKLSKSTGMKGTFNYNIPGDPLADELKINIYRILQELTTNIIKYSQATLVTVEIWLSGENLRMTITDDGKGFNVKAKRGGIGISNIYSRAQSFNGSIKIESSEGKGTKTMISIPYKG